MLAPMPRLEPVRRMDMAAALEPGRGRDNRAGTDGIVASTTDEIVADFPELASEHVRAALDFAALRERRPALA